MGDDGTPNGGQLMSVLEFEITKGPSVWQKDHVVLESLAELRRLCRMFDIPLMHMPNIKKYSASHKQSCCIQHTYDVYFASMSGMYYTYMEQNEETEGVSS